MRINIKIALDTFARLGKNRPERDFALRRTVAAPDDPDQLGQAMADAVRDAAEELSGDIAVMYAVPVPSVFIGVSDLFDPAVTDDPATAATEQASMRAHLAWAAHPRRDRLTFSGLDVETAVNDPAFAPVDRRVRVLARLRVRLLVDGKEG